MDFKKPLLLLLCPLLFFSNLISADEITLKGKVFDINTHRGIAYANVYVSDTQIGTISDFAGRFELIVPNPHSKMKVAFQHINYDVKTVNIKELTSGDVEIYLQPRVIPLQAVEVQAVGEKLEIKKDLPQMTSLVKAKDFELRGYVDAADLLRADHSVQVEEELSGKKTISIRGGNADDVVVLYNGIKMNSQFNNIFDLSLIDLEDVQRFELIKGSNTVLYGSEAFSGVVNIVPKTQEDYTIRFQQRVGTYDSGNWGLHFFKNVGNLYGSYSFRKGGAKRRFSGSGENYALENRATHHTANVEYHFSETDENLSANTLGLTYIRSTLDYLNNRDNETVANLNQIIGLRYSGNIYKLKNVVISASQRQLDETQSLNNQFGILDRELEDQTNNIRLEKTFTLKQMELLVSYHFEHGQLNFSDWRSDFDFENINQEASSLERMHHGIASILKFHLPSGSEMIDNVDFDFSVRHDKVVDKAGDQTLQSTISTDNLNTWDETMFKFATKFSGMKNDFAFDVFMNIGKNVKFPSLSQLISSELAFQQTSLQPNLEPEKNNSVEIGLVLKRHTRYHPTIYGWQITANYIKNNYDNKFRPLYIFGMPIAFYDNVPDARISGFETKSSVFLLRKKITVEFGFSQYDISEKAAFPFKYDMKRIANLMLDHAGYSLLLHWFIESEQTGWVRQPNGLFNEVILPEYMNVDIHLSKSFRLHGFKVFGNVSIRNLLNDDTDLEGLALRDHRYYLTAGIEF